VDHDNDDLIAVLRRIEQNQQRALELQEKHFALAQAQFDKSNVRIEESLGLQRVAVQRQEQIRNIAFPLVLVLLFLLGYLVVRWQVF
jgi:hypothetical protein